MPTGTCHFNDPVRAVQGQQARNELLSRSHVQAWQVSKT
jgi:hypothetical protein